MNTCPKCMSVDVIGPNYHAPSNRFTYLCRTCGVRYDEPWRWTSAVWPSGSTNAHPRHIVHAGSPVAVCGYRAQRIDGERWYTRDYTDRVKCSKCAAWESKQPTESKEPT